VNAGSDRRDLRALLLIAAGVVWLVVESGGPAAASGLGFYWPLLLVGVGLDLLGWTRPWRVPYTVLAAAVVLLGTLVAPSPLGSGRPTQLAEPVGSARAASVRLELSDAASSVAAGHDPASLVTVHTDGWRHAVLDATGSDPKAVRVRPASGGRRPALSLRGSHWRIDLVRNLPLALTVNAGSGRARLDLSRLNLTSLRLQGGSGAVAAVLPDSVSRYRAVVALGSGASALQVASGAAVDLELDTGSGRTSVTFAEFSAGRVTLRAGSGPVVIDVPGNAPVQLVVTGVGSGALRVAGFLKRTSGTGETGVWRTGPGAGGLTGIDILVQRAGSGPITVR